MTTVEDRPVRPAVRPLRPAPPTWGARLRARLFAPGWPIAWGVVGFPLWWAMGVTPFIFPAVGALLLRELVQQRRRQGRLVHLPGAWLWGLFLAIVAISAVMLNVRLAGTLPPSGYGRFIAYAFRLFDYAAVYICALYVINTPERALPRLRVMRWMGLLAVWCIVLGLVSLVVPRADFPTLLSVALPQSLSDTLSGGVGKATLAQVQPVLGVYAPRPAAPFPFTNAWGSSLALLMVWLLVVGWAGRTRARLAVAAVAAVAVVPVVYSLNRGVWIGMGLGLGYVAVRLAARGRLLALGALTLLLSLGTIGFLASPLQAVVAERLQHGHSNDIRGSLAVQALDAAASSPLLGYGSTRAVLGSSSSITVGKTASCPKCGNAEIGSTGQWFLLLVSQGFLGAGVYLAFFVRALWAYRRDSSPTGVAGTLVVLMSLFFGIAYSALIIPLTTVFLSLALLWRSDALRTAAAAGRTAAQRAAGTPAPAPAAAAVPASRA